LNGRKISIDFYLAIPLWLTKVILRRSLGGKLLYYCFQRVAKNGALH